ncbi:MAG: hypothetical protein ONB13_12130, partial [candidate division KSB1 bacterium]|nr:hypothetical protein [candidate division KSB1 bacterium]
SKRVIHKILVIIFILNSIWLAFRNQIEQAGRKKNAERVVNYLLENLDFLYYIDAQIGWKP